MEEGQTACGSLFTSLYDISQLKTDEGAGIA
jgi:hypothetical protein